MCTYVYNHFYKLIDPTGLSWLNWNSGYPHYSLLRFAWNWGLHATFQNPRTTSSGRTVKFTPKYIIVGVKGGESEFILRVQCFSFGHLGPHAKFQNEAFLFLGYFWLVVRFVDNIGFLSHQWGFSWGLWLRLTNIYAWKNPPKFRT